MLEWRRNWWIVVTTRFAHAEFIVTIMITGAAWWDCMSKNLPLSITARADRGVTCYEGGGEKSCISIDGDHGRSAVGASGLELGPSGRGDFRVVDLGEV